MNFPPFISLIQNRLWQGALHNFLESDKGRVLQLKVQNAYAEGLCYPPYKLLFEAFKHSSPTEVKVFILGQDPYINPHQAMGLSFSVPAQSALPPSLRNIFKEIREDIGLSSFPHGNLSNWAQRGVMLYNAIGSVSAGVSLSHKDFGWEALSDEVIKILGAENQTPKVFMLWGAFARKKKQLIAGGQHLILEAAHPSPLSANNGFFGCKHFSKANAFLASHQIPEIDWRVG